MAMAFGLVLGAWVLFSLAMAKHQQALLARMLPPRVTPWLRMVAWGFLAAGLATCIWAKGWSQGPIFWGALLIFAAIAWVLLMTFVPKRAVAASLVFALATAVL